MPDLSNLNIINLAVTRRIILWDWGEAKWPMGVKACSVRKGGDYSSYGWTWNPTRTDAGPPGRSNTKLILLFWPWWTCLPNLSHLHACCWEPVLVGFTLEDKKLSVPQGHLYVEPSISWLHSWTSSKSQVYLRGFNTGELTPFFSFSRVSCWAPWKYNRTGNKRKPHGSQQPCYSTWFLDQMCAITNYRVLLDFIHLFFVILT